MRTQEINKKIVQDWHENINLYSSECPTFKGDWGEKQREKRTEVKAPAAERGFNGL